jgi:ABC-type Mn2+/Zn2+ transport system permease subunit
LRCLSFSLPLLSPLLALRRWKIFDPGIFHGF